MKNEMLQTPGGTQKLERGFRKVEPLCEGIRLAPDAQVRDYLLMCYSRRRAEENFERYTLAKVRLSSLYGGVIGAVERGSGGYMLSARLDFLTIHETMDRDLCDSVASAGFVLHHMSRPVLSGSLEEMYETRFRGGTWDAQLGRYEYTPYTVQKMINVYSIREGDRTMDLANAAESAEGMLRLAIILRPAGLPEDLPAAKEAGDGARIVDIGTARAARSSKPPPPQEEEKPVSGAGGSKAS